MSDLDDDACLPAMARKETRAMNLATLFLYIYFPSGGLACGLPYAVHPLQRERLPGRTTKTVDIHSVMDAGTWEQIGWNRTTENGGIERFREEKDKNEIYSSLYGDGLAGFTVTGVDLSISSLFCTTLDEGSEHVSNRDPTKYIMKPSTLGN